MGGLPEHQSSGTNERCHSPTIDEVMTRNTVAVLSRVIATIVYNTSIEAASD